MEYIKVGEEGKLRKPGTIETRKIE